MDRDILRAIAEELDRIGVQSQDLPGLAMDAGAERAFLERLRHLAAGATMQDIFPETPTHWVTGDPETYTTRYRPLGPYDYQAPPSAPAIHVVWPKDTDPACLASLVTEARASGWDIHGAGFLDVTNPEWPTLDAMIVVARTTSREQLAAFLVWLEEEQGIDVAAIPRTGEETYL